MNEYILALDFDGVVWDSVGESCYVAFKAWEKLFGPLPPGLEAGFRAGRWLVRTGQDFYLLLKLLIEDPSRRFADFSKAEFAAILAQHQEDATRFDAVFYQTRDEERTSHPEQWLSVQPPYREFMDAFPALQGAFREIVVTTTKDEASVRFLLGRHGIVLPVLGKEFSREKNQQIRWLAQDRRISLAQVLLLDDLLDNLRPVRQAGSRVALATWGYNTEAERQEAAGDGIPLIHGDRILADLEQALGCN